MTTNITPNVFPARPTVANHGSTSQSDNFEPLQMPRVLAMLSTFYRFVTEASDHFWLWVLSAVVIWAIESWAANNSWFPIPHPGFVLVGVFALVLIVGWLLSIRELRIQKQNYDAQWGHRDSVYKWFRANRLNARDHSIDISPSMRITWNRTIKSGTSWSQSGVVEVEVLENGSWLRIENAPGSHWAEILAFCNTQVPSV